MESPDLQKKNNYFAGILTAKHQLYHSIMVRHGCRIIAKGDEGGEGFPFIRVSNKFIIHVFMRRVPYPTDLSLSFEIRYHNNNNNNNDNNKKINSTHSADLFLLIW